MTLLRYFFLLSLLVFLSNCKTVQPAPSLDEMAIRNARLSSNAAIASKDTNAIAQYWADDYHLVSSRNSEVAGRVKNRHNFATELYTKKEVLYVRSSQKVDVYAPWNMAAETGVWTGQWREPDGLVQLKGSYLAKWHKINGEWKIRAEIFVPLSCTGSSFCDKKPF
jgi:ketosteroid isomerase-like protein